MAQSNYQEPIEKEDLDLGKKFSAQGESAYGGQSPESSQTPNPKKNLINEEISVSEKLPEKEEMLPPTEPAESILAKGIETPGLEKESAGEAREEKVSEKIETARKTISAHKAPAVTTIADDAKTVAGIAEYEKKVEKLVELALQKGPEHAVKVAQHMDANDNYTLDELHDKMIEDDLRKQLIQRGLLKEL
ncbi:hypothetical protein D4R51_01005 [bacterium]|nr:MAG: hypothetical protein D4R51_01005 [bacterium]